MKSIFILVVVVAVSVTRLFGADDTTMVTTDTTAPTYSFSAMAGGGWAHDVSDFESPKPGIEVNRNQYSFFARIMWHPEHLLSAGIEGGYAQFYSIKGTKGGTSLRGAMPFYIVMSMKVIEGLSASTGFGVGIESSSVQGGGLTIDGSAVSFSVMGAISYLHPIADRLSLGIEARYTSMDLYDDRLFTLSALVKYRFSDY